MLLTADLHVHSRFSRATARDLCFASLHRAALMKGLGLVATGDFTHPGWLAEIEEQLEPAEDGLFRLKADLARAASADLPPVCRGDVRFVLEVEISSIYKQADRVRKNHNLVYMPSLDAARRFNEALGRVGNLASDGRPILGLASRDLLEIALEADARAFLVPAHIWTPWFSVLGSKSGFDGLDECFGDLAHHVFAAETGLSSDPPMNWRVSALDRLTLISNSDAHSAAKLGREANLLDIEPGFGALRRALETREGFLGTVEFFPEEGKYHLDGHRKCGARLNPDETRASGGKCPVCGAAVTVGVMSRVEDLADRPSGVRPENASPFTSLVPLDELAGEALGVGAGSKKARDLVEKALFAIGPELHVLKDAPIEDVRTAGGPALAEAVRRVRAGELHIEAGYDGEFGVVRIFGPGERDHLAGQTSFSRGTSPAACSEGEATRFRSNLSPARAASRSDKATGGDGAGVHDAYAEWTAPVPGPVAIQRPARDSRAACSDPLDGLDEGQRAMATEPTGPLLVVAGPGTGKTRSLVARMAFHVREGRVHPEQVLAIAFTNQAAQELKERVARSVPGARPGAPLVTTFHGFGLGLLREVTGADVRILDDDERLEVLETEAGEGLAKAGLKALLERLSLAKQERDPRAALASYPEILGAYDRYEAGLSRMGAVDVDDLVARPLALLDASPDVSRRVSSRFGMVLVDEYQDVNDAQAALVAHLAPFGRTLAVIGDPNQAIYGFRGAQPGHFARFKEAFGRAREVRLKVTYRLTAQVLEAARAIAGDCVLLAARKTGPKVEIVGCPSAQAEAREIATRIERLVGGTNSLASSAMRTAGAEPEAIGFGEAAVLVRLKTQRVPILEALGRAGIPCRAIGEDEPHDPRSQKVAVMTMHAAKGREFEAVFIAGCEEGLMPLALEGFAVDEAEERRLLYVALTRARHMAVVTHASRRAVFGRSLPGRPSPFLAAIPDETAPRTVARAPASRPGGKQLSLF
ncbi:MAG: UvrD-helicase domain-containing protein [Deltaproteobacteria bacterium]|nr:UvrD-helicase domain-containing protein [Deltaproteobacteria bacterium]